MLLVTDADTNPEEYPEALMRSAAGIALEREGIDPARCEASLLFVSPNEIREMNARYRGNDCETDVLSFPMYENAEALRGALDLNTARAETDSSMLVLIGDVVICREIAEKQAEDIGHSAERELIYLFVHSIFHLLGYDHEDEEGRRAMREAEEDVLCRLEE